ncbi:hypothetical protein [Streptomyces sp. NPDC046821]|uniref:hypothetical protein n=1 Tax=Streptomyces sp. NPDC046821 TaxID=3154702 RepID=UPI0033E94E38
MLRRRSRGASSPRRTRTSPPSPWTRPRPASHPSTKRPTSRPSPPPGNHPFWDATHHRWTDAHNLTPGTKLRQPDGTTVVIRGVRNFQRHSTTYDLTVGTLHYVLAGEAPLLVHNCPTGWCGRSSRLRAERHPPSPTGCAGQPERSTLGGSGGYERGGRGAVRAYAGGRRGGGYCRREPRQQAGVTA